MTAFRTILVAVAAALATAATADDRPGFATIAAETPGRIGVLALDTVSGRQAGWDAEGAFPLNSSFKVLLCAAILERVDAGDETLDRLVPVSAGDIVGHSPVTEAKVGGEMTVGALCEAATTTSDNGATNLLLAALGGPEALTARLRAWGDPVTRLDRTEPAMNDVGPDDPRDRTSPAAMVATLDALLLGEVLSEASRARLLGWMEANTTGDARIRAGIPADWKVGDRTGTGRNGTGSTVAILMPPGRAPVLMAVYVENSGLSNDDLSALHARLAAAAVAAIE
jgi:beta-lactamase class A